MLNNPIKKVAWLTASAAGLLLAAGVAAQDAEQYDQYTEDQRAHASEKTSKMKSFSDLDTDGDGALVWSDVERTFGDKIDKANWDEQQVMEQFDTDGDQQLSEEEYDSFQTALLAQSSGAVASDSQGAVGSQEIDDNLLTMSVDEITNAEIVNSRGEEIGSVSRVVRDNDSGNLSLIVESGGVLGVGATSVMVNLEEVSQMDENQLLWDTMLSRDDLAEMPEFDDSQYTEVSALDSTLNEVQESN